MTGFNAHDRTAGEEEWLTPREITDALGPFDLDPCAPVNRPWEIAPKVYTAQDNGLRNPACPWEGFVYVNPPYGNETGKWLDQLADHDNGIALIFARTETQDFFRHVWGRADSLVFIRGRLRFWEQVYDPEGNYVGARPGCSKKTGKPCSAGAPSVLVGKFVLLRQWI